MKVGQIMLKLVRYLKPFVFLIIFIIGLLYTQAVCDLALPQYMSNIVNTGIQQKGISSAVPEVIRATEYDRIMLFLSPKNQAKVNTYYKTLDKAKLSAAEYAKYVKKYPALKNEILYKLNTTDKNKIEKINIPLGRAILIVATIEKDGFKNMNNNITLPANVDPFIILKAMPAAQFEQMQNNIAEKINGLPDNMITQASSIYIENEYQTIGVDTVAVQKKYIFNTGLMMSLIALLSMTASVVVGFVAAKVASGLGRNLRQSLFNKVENFSNVEFDKFGASSLITRTTNDIQQIQNLMVMLLRIVFYAPILGVGGVIKVLATDTSMGWIIAVAMGAIFIVVGGMFIFAVPKFKTIQKLIDKLNLVTRESLTGMLVIRAFNTQKYEEVKFDKANKDLTKTNLFINRVMSGMFPIMMLIMNFITILIVWVGAHQIDKGAIQVGDMMAFIQYTMQIIMAFVMITMISIMLPRATVSAGRIDEVLSVEPTIIDPKEPKKFNKKIKGQVVFNNVSFKYDEAEDYVLKNISFEAKPGETTAFIGSTGSGKSTLINLIPRFYDVTEGEVLIDGINIKDVKQHDLRDKIGYVPQKGILFSGTIASNLKYGKPNAKEEEIIKAAEIAQALSFIEEKDHKFKEPIAQGGTNVSGGQKQRLAIARALVKKPEIYMFDDTFSALDFKTDANLRQALKPETEKQTVLIVAQRISTIMNAEQIIVLEKGEMVGRGTHDELMKNCKVYREIALSQLSKKELA